MRAANENQAPSVVAAVISVIGILAAFASGSSAMDLKMVGNQLILSGPVVNGDFEKVQQVLVMSPMVDAIVLRNSPGGDIPAGYRLGELFRAKDLRTMLSGYCYSSCSRMFLGGKTRYFTDDYPAVYSNVGFHGHYDLSSGRLRRDLVEKYDLKAWTIRYSDGMADAELVERWVNIPINIGLIHFYHPELYKRGGASTFMCQGTEPMARSVLGCEPIHKTALDLGIVTSLAIARSNDQTELRAAFTERPKPSGYAEIDDLTKVVLSGGNWQEEYRRFLAAVLPRAIALSPDGNHWAWNAGGLNVMMQALGRCAQLSNQTCTLYAVDNDVVWTR